MQMRCIIKTERISIHLWNKTFFYTVTLGYFMSRIFSNTSKRVFCDSLVIISTNKKKFKNH